MLYFQTIMKRSENDLTRRVYDAQRENSNKGDRTQYLKEDFSYIKNIYQ